MGIRVIKVVQQRARFVTVDCIGISVKAVLCGADGGLVMALVAPIILAVTASTLKAVYPALAEAISSWLYLKSHIDNSSISISSSDSKIKLDEDDLKILLTAIEGNPAQTNFQVSIKEKYASEEIKVLLARKILKEIYRDLESALPKLETRLVRSRSLKLLASVIALASNVAVLGAIGFGQRETSIVAAVIALLVSAIKLFEDSILAGIKVTKYKNLPDLLVYATKIQLEARQTLLSFEFLSKIQAPPAEYPLKEAERISKELKPIIADIKALLA